MIGSVRVGQRPKAKKNTYSMVFEFTFTRIALCESQIVR